MSINQIVNNGSVRNHAIDIMKFLAAIFITNSHIESLYPEKVKILATGGAIGDALFFFCSGFCLMNGGSTDFFNWYKRRINRIFPTIFAVALIGILFCGSDPTLKQVIINGGGWFVKAIMLFYVFFWFVKRFFSDKLWIAFAVDFAIILVWFIWFWDKNIFILADATYLRWPGYFIIMLMGAAMNCFFQKQTEEHKEGKGWMYIGLLFVFTSLYYGYQVLWDYYPILKDFQIVLIPLLMGIIYAIFKLCSNEKALKVYLNKYLHWALYGISACCLEIYLSGGWSFSVGRKLIRLFPLNIIVTFLLIFVVAYIVKVFSNFLSQTFKEEKYNWKGMVKL